MLLQKHCCFVVCKVDTACFRDSFLEIVEVSPRQILNGELDINSEADVHAAQKFWCLLLTVSSPGGKNIMKCPALVVSYKVISCPYYAFPPLPIAGPLVEWDRKRHSDITKGRERGQGGSIKWTWKL